MSSWSEFVQIIGGHNNLAFRNFNVLQLAASSAGLEAWAPLIIPGAPMPAAFDFIIEIDECPEVRWEIFVPDALAAAVLRDDDDERIAIDDKKYAPLRLPVGKRLRLSDVRLAGRARHQCRVRAVVRERPEEPCFLRVSQWYRGQEIGRATFEVSERSWTQHEDRAL
jgi:hypothetical protein